MTTGWTKTVISPFSDVCIVSRGMRAQCAPFSAGFGRAVYSHAVDMQPVLGTNDPTRTYVTPAQPPPPPRRSHALNTTLAVKQLILFTCILDYDPAICDIYPVVSNVLREAPLTFGPKCCCGYTRTAPVFPVCRRIDSAGSSQSQEFLQHNEVTMFISKSASDKT